MTLTETRPAVAANVPDSWLTTGDHKRLGLAFIYGGVAALLASCVTAIAYQLLNDDPLPWTAAGSRLASANTTVALLIGIPALWIGLATYIVPLQLGATRLALPRLHNLALWTYFAGGVLVSIAYAAGRPRLNSLASSVPSMAIEGRSAKPVTELLIAGIFVVALATFFAAVSLLTTVLLRRADGLRLTFLPLFSWSTVGTATVLVLATPVFLAGLVLLFYDQHYGGTLFASGEGALRIWQHELWLLGQPFALLFLAAGIGLIGDVVATHAGRPLVGFPLARVAAAAAPLATLLLWTGNVSTLQSPFGPVASAAALVVGAPLGLSLLTWLGTLKNGTPKAHPSLLFAVAFLAVIGLATALSTVAAFADMQGVEAEAFRNGQITLLVFGAPLLALSAAAAHWSPKLWGRVTPAGAAGLQYLLLLGGAVLTAVPGYLVGLGVAEGVAIVGVVGSAMTAAGLLLFIANLAARGASTDANPYGGLTLEWATASPPPVHNFDELPDIRSAHPLEAGAPVLEGSGR